MRQGWSSQGMKNGFNNKPEGEKNNSAFQHLSVHYYSSLKSDVYRVFFFYLNLVKMGKHEPF